MTAVRNERGIALLIVLIVVALLTITVTEFTFSVQLDQHRTRNAMHAMQASLLARSGINIMEGFLLQDGVDPNRQDATWCDEEWWIQLREFCQGLQLDESTLVRCSVKDEGGKINVNRTYEARQQDRVTPSAVVRTAMKCLFQKVGVEVAVVDELNDYWQQTSQTDAQGNPVPVPEFESLEGYVAWVNRGETKITAEQLQQLRPLMTARPTRTQSRAPGLRLNRVPAININTAPLGVLAALLAGESCSGSTAYEDVVNRRSTGEPIEKGEIAGLVGSLEDANSPGMSSAVQQLLGVDSNLYRLEASVLTNVDPENPSRGGIGQTLSEVVERRPAVGAPTRPGALGGQQSDRPLWTLRTLDWQKEGGARLFNDQDDDPCEGGLSDNPDGSTTPMPNR